MHLCERRQFDCVSNQSRLGRAAVYLGAAVGYLLLLIAGLATVATLATVGLIAARGATPARFMTTLVATGVATSTGFTGWFIRKRIARNVVPIDVDETAAFRGGQGGL